jgi:hypothetical protein
MMIRHPLATLLGALLWLGASTGARADGPRCPVLLDELGPRVSGCLHMRTTQTAAGLAASPGATTGAAPTVDLFPPTVFDVTRSHGLLATPVPRRPGRTYNENGPRGVLPVDDGDWRVQTAEVGVIVGAFAALSILCRDGCSKFMP